MVLSDLFVYLSPNMKESTFLPDQVNNMMRHQVLQTFSRPRRDSREIPKWDGYLKNPPNYHLSLIKTTNKRLNSSHITVRVIFSILKLRRLNGV